MKSTLQKVATNSLLLAGLLYSTWATALGLGEIDVSSRLNERFNAEVPLANEGRLDRTQILITLAEPKDFQRAGIDRPFFLTSLKFKIENSASGGKVLKITTPDVLREPFLNFILEVRWPTGRMLKEYTVLLDLPISQFNEQLNESNTAASSASASASLATSQPAQTVSREVLNPVKKSERPVVTGSAADLLPRPVRFSESSKLAEKIQSEPSKQSNTFVESASKALVNKDVDTKSNIKTKPADTGVDVDLEVARLQTELAKSLENLDKAELENKELEERIGSVESQVDDFEKLVKLKSQEIEAVQSSIEQKQKQLVELNVGDSQFSDEEPIELESEQVAAAAVDAENAALVNSWPQETRPTVELNETQLAAAAPTLSAKTSFLSRLSQQLSVSVNVLMGVLIAAVIFLIGLLWTLKSRAKDDYSATVFEPQNELAETEPANDSYVSEAEAYVEKVEPVTEPVLNEQQQVEEAFSAVPQAVVSDDTEAMPEDPLAEADIYMAYGRYDQAIDLLQRAIEAEPERTDVRVKLLETYQEQGTLEQNAEVVACQREYILRLDAGLALEVDALLQPATDVSSDVDLDHIGENISPSDLGLDLDLDLHDTDISTGEVSLETQDANDDESLEEEVDTKLDLARAYFDMGDFDGARGILQEVIEEGGDSQQAQAKDMLSKFA